MVICLFVCSEPFFHFSHTSHILDFMENKNTLNPRNTVSTDSGKSHYGLKGDTIGTKDAFLVYYKKVKLLVNLSDYLLVK